MKADQRPASIDETWSEHWVPSHHKGHRLYLRHQSAMPRRASPRRIVLYVHGATFPSELSIAYRFDGTSWADRLCEAEFDVWGFDFHGFGHSDRFKELDQDPSHAPPLGRASDAATQIELAVRWICARECVSSISIIAHSWGTLAAGLFATRCPNLVDRLVFFGPIARRTDATPMPALPAWLPITVEAQRTRFVADVPAAEAQVLDPRHFAAWSTLFLASDPTSGRLDPPAVRVPAGPVADLMAAHRGELPYDPALIQAPVAIIRGEWDSLITDSDAAWLWGALTAAPEKRDVKISRATHLMHLESGRHALHDEALAFLLPGPSAMAPPAGASG